MNNATVVGIDIARHGVRVVELKFGSVITVTYGQEYLFTEPSDQNNLIELAAAAIERCFHGKRRVSSRKALIAMAMSDVLSRRVMVPADEDDSEIETRIEREIPQYLGLDSDEVYFDFCRYTNGSAHNTSDSQEILLLASRRDRVDERRAILKTARVKVAGVDVDGFALLAACQQMAQHSPEELPWIVDKKLYAIVQVEPELVLFYLVAGDQLIHHRDQPIEPPHSPELDKPAVDFAEPFEPKVNDDNQQDIVFAKHLAEHLEQTKEYYSSSNSYNDALGNTIHGIVLCGTGGFSENMATHLADKSHCPVVIGNPFVGMDCQPRRVSSLVQTSPARFMLACGLAMRGRKP